MSLRGSLGQLVGRPPVELPQVAGFNTPGYPQKMMGMSMSEDEIKIYWNRGEVQGMRSNYLMAVKVLMTVTRVLPDDPYHLVMETD
ncbi:hypothetical protein Mal15_55630 [Stieleria maiorica]|uniref:Uncharacterized protein n=1 Tax=Stieleria maiorica TaxID=2795974 RepID=A0A5B9MPA0_9BACT|nr:hypothetical protein [Stieleria maiorica]QEG01486.1 hypothetical protein Mal15_55630 [Stieleria maiorica]